MNAAEQREAAGERPAVFDREEQPVGGARVLKQPEQQAAVPIPPKEEGYDFVHVIRLTALMRLFFGNEIRNGFSIR